MSITQLGSLRQKLKELRLQHRHMDTQITEANQLSYMNSLQLQRLKKKKLALKDTIVKLESLLIPDINA